MADKKRLIDANKIKYTEYRGGGGREYPENVVTEDEIAKMPTVDAVEVVHGHWCWEGRFRACSECGSYVEFTETLGASHWKYCPYCGAKMDQEAS